MKMQEAEERQFTWTWCMSWVHEGTATTIYINITLQLLRGVNYILNNNERIRSNH